MAPADRRARTLAAPNAALAITPAAALAAAPGDQYHDHFSDSFSANICDVGVYVNGAGTTNFTHYEDSTSNAALRAAGDCWSPRNSVERKRS